MKFFNSIRIEYPNWISEQRFEDILKMIKKHPCDISQIAFITANVHTPVTLADMEKRLEILKKRMERARGAGLSPGIDMLATIGHHSEDLSNCLNGDYYRMTNINGKACKGSFCMTDKRYINDYVIPVYEMMAQSKPDFIWSDDDVRYQHMPVGKGCFCDGCIDKFNRMNGTEYTRDTLRKAFRSNVELRKLWLDKQSLAMKELFDVLSDTVRSVDKKITLGFMCGEWINEGNDFPLWCEALSENGKYEIMLRPGGSAYSDDKYCDYVFTSGEVGRQNAYIPAYVTSVQNEIENFPHPTFGKTSKSLAAEYILGITSGCSGAAFNILPGETGEPVKNAERHLAALNGITPFARLVFEKLSGSSPCGIHANWDKYIAASVPSENFWEREISFSEQVAESSTSYNYELLSIGLPEAFNKQYAKVFTVNGENLSVMERNDIISLLSGGVYMDVSALEYLNANGFEEYTGFRVEKKFEVDAIEEYTDTLINNGIFGGKRNGRQEFNPGDAYSLVSVSDDVQMLSKPVDYHGNVIGECCMGLYENSLGGRICVSGYYPYNSLNNYFKSTQLKKIFRWLSRDGLPAYVESETKIRNLSYEKEGRVLVSLFNYTNDSQKNVCICIKTDSDEAIVYYSNCVPQKICASAADGGYKKFVVDEIPPFEILLAEVSSQK